MKVTIYYKNNQSQVATEAHDFDLKEFALLSTDFASYLKEGSPKIGIYRVATGETRAGIQFMKELVLEFDKISVIG